MRVREGGRRGRCSGGFPTRRAGDRSFTLEVRTSGRGGPSPLELADVPGSAPNCGSYGAPEITSAKLAPTVVPEVTVTLRFPESPPGSAKPLGTRRVTM